MALLLWMAEVLFMTHHRILQGDVLAGLRMLPDGSQLKTGVVEYQFEQVP